jgi:hypothetical protein
LCGFHYRPLHLLREIGTHMVGDVVKGGECRPYPIKFYRDGGIGLGFGVGLGRGAPLVPIITP